MLSPFLELLREAGRVLDELGVPWYLFGAQAALLYGATRLTADVDLTVALGELPTETLLGALERGGFRLRLEAGKDPDFVAVTRVLPVVHLGTDLPADIVLAGPGLEELFLSRVVIREIGGLRVPIASAEDIVTMKILAGRPKDLEDAVSILAARTGALDLSQIRDTLLLLEQALDQSDLLPALETALRRSRSQQTCG